MKTGLFLQPSGLVITGPSPFKREECNGLLLENMIEGQKGKYDYFFNIWLDPKEGREISKQMMEKLTKSIVWTRLEGIDY